MRQITRQFILWYGLFETFVFTGNIFGWTALHYMLRQEGIYEHVCDSQDNDTHTYANETESSAVNLRGYRTCEAQDSILNLAYTIGSFCMGSTSFVWGFLLDKWGLRNVRLIINREILFRQGFMTVFTRAYVITERGRSLLVLSLLLLKMKNDQGERAYLVNGGLPPLE
ncbi:solute carrier family 43 member 3 [Trichonephila clavipes]|nr:solute carrier family 43 member 3 [Trichonephila clavipes]